MSEHHYLCEYKFAGDDWSVIIVARTPAEAMQRMDAIAFSGRVKGEISAAGWMPKYVARLVIWFFGVPK